MHEHILIKFWSIGAPFAVGITLQIAYILVINCHYISLSPLFFDNAMEHRPIIGYKAPLCLHVVVFDHHTNQLVSLDFDGVHECFHN